MRLLHPIPGARITQRFGENPHRYGYGAAGHRGADFSAVVGTPVRLGLSGDVRRHDTGAAGFGLHGRITVGNVEVIYGHLSRVQPGPARAGDVALWSGNTGNSTAPHLHLEVRINGVAVDPLPLLVDTMDELEEERAMSKLGLHFQRLPAWHRDVVNQSAVKWVKMIDPTGPYPYARPVNIIGRLWIGGDHVEQGYIDQGAAGADEYFNMLLPRYMAAPWVTVWECPNEPAPYWSKLGPLCRFSVRWAEHMHSIGRKVAVGGFSAGQPDWGHIVQMGDALKIADYWHLHEYSQPTMQTDSGVLCLRYKRLAAELRAAKVRVPPLLITETGIDGGAVTPERQHQARPKKGWKTFATREGYQAQLAWYDDELCRDPDVEVATPFVSEAVPEWMDFDFDEAHARWLCGRHVADPMEAQRAHKIRINPTAGLWKAMRIAGHVPGSDEYSHNGRPRQWGYQERAGAVDRWHLWEWGADGARVIHSEDVRT